ncbi:MAG: GTP-binding protein [Lachnospiraceae bacterium]
MMKNQKKQTYLITGFLESGKTEFIKYTLDQPYFKAEGKTLLLVCEDGEVHYDRPFLRRNNIVLEVLEDESEFTIETLTTLDQKHNPERIVIEYNGMWNHRDIRFPVFWKLEQQITIIDASTFAMYYANMKSMIGEMVRNAELIICNRAQGIEELVTYKRNIKLVNQQAEIVFEGADEEITTVLEEELPYDMQAEVIDITEQAYPIWFFDAMEETQRYVGKKVSFIGRILKRPQYPANYFIPVRVIMTCCEDDMATLGFVCEYEGASGFAEGTWVRIKAVVANEYWEDYGAEGPVLHAYSVESVPTPKNEIL